MKKTLIIAISFMFLEGISMPAFAGEHGGKEHGGSAKGSPMEVKAPPAPPVVVKPSKDDIRNTMQSYVEKAAASTGTFDVTDPDTGEVLNLNLERVHERVGKTGNYYYSCADMKDTKSGMMFDLDLDVEQKSDGSLQVVEVRVHKEDGVARYTYDDKDNRHPLKEGTKSHVGIPADHGSPKGSDHAEEMAGGMKGSAAQEHGGQEHGGK